MLPLDRRFRHISGGPAEDEKIVGAAVEEEEEDVKPPLPPQEEASAGGSLPRRLSVEDLFAPLTRLDVKYLPDSHLSAPHPSHLSVRHFPHPQALSSSSSPSLALDSFPKSERHHPLSVNMATIPEESVSGLPDRSCLASDSVSDEAGASGTSKGKPRNKSRCAMSRSPVSGHGNELLQQNSNSDEDQQVVDDRKQRRMLSNRESARRSRLRKQQHLDELQAQVAQLRAQNSQMLSRFNLASQHFAQISEENRLLRSEAMDLSHQLQRLHHMVVAHRANGVRYGNRPGGQMALLDK